MAKRNLEQILKDNATYWAQRYTILAKSHAPKHIAPHITTKSKVSGQSVTIESTVAVVDMRGAEGQISNYGTLDAVAQEFGHPGASILPRVKTVLAFKWQKAPANIKKDKEGKVRLPYVTKKPQPAFNSDNGYMRPAADDWTDEIMKSSSKFKDAIRLDTLESFTKITKANLSK